MIMYIKIDFLKLLFLKNKNFLLTMIKIIIQYSLFMLNEWQGHCVYNKHTLFNESFARVSSTNTRFPWFTAVPKNFNKSNNRPNTTGSFPGSRVPDISFEGFFENELESDFLSFLHSSNYENLRFSDSEIIRKHLKMTVIKTVKYPPVQSKHQTPSRIFFYQFLWCILKKKV
jgi:hypothetical protein